jgi:hypothetical protein
VEGTNAIGGDTQEDSVTLLPLAITFSAGAGATGLVVQGAPTSTWPFRFRNIPGLTGGNAGASQAVEGFMAARPYRPNSRSYRRSSLAICDRTMTTCINVFNNQQLGQSIRRFGGFPFIPLPETAA